MRVQFDNLHMSQRRDKTTHYRDKIMTKKKTDNKKTEAAAVAQIDWAAETAAMRDAAKNKYPGSRGDQLGKVADFLDKTDPGSLLLRERAASVGAAIFIESPRNVLAKLPRLATCIASQQPWCSAAALDPSATRKEDASVAIALIHLGAGNARQKMIVAEAQARYRGGASAQMPAALDACCILGVIERKPGGPRNAEYIITDEAVASRLIPSAAPAA